MTERLKKKKHSNKVPDQILKYYIQTGISGPFSRFFNNICENGEAE